MLRIYRTRRVLRLFTDGRLAPWLGPALRGLAAQRFKARVCRHSPREQETTWRHCKGCPLMRECPYGLTLEADPPEQVQTFSGQEDGVRPIVIAPDFPVPQRGQSGMKIPTSVTFVGEQAARQAELFWEVVDQAGRDPRGGLDPDRTLFRVEAAEGDGWQELELPPRADALGEWVDRVEVELTSPLLLRQGASEGRRRQLLHQPSFADLLRASLRVVGTLCRYFGRPVEADFAGLRQSAETVLTLEASFRPFRQVKHSNRTQQRGLVVGTTGVGVYGPLPAALVCWLTAGGLVHVGPHRVAGAGGWSVTVE